MFGRKPNRRSRLKKPRRRRNAISLTVDFFCSNCEAQLRTSLAKTGQFITCPVCDISLRVPSQSELSPLSQANDFASEEANDSPEGSLQEFDLDFEQCAECGSLTPSGTHCRTCHPTEVSQATFPDCSARDITSRSWEIYKEKISQCVLAGIVDFIATMVGFTLVILIAVLAALTVRFDRQIAVLTLLVVFALGFALLVGSLAAGNYRFFIALCRGESPKASSLMHFDPKTGQIVVAGLIYWGLAIVGLICGIIPGLIVLSRLWPHGRLIIDKNLGIVDSLIESSRITRGRFFVVFPIFLLHLVIMIASASLSIVGAIFAFPLAGVLYSVTYLTLTEHVAEKDPIRSNL